MTFHLHRWARRVVTLGIAVLLFGGGAIVGWGVHPTTSPAPLQPCLEALQAADDALLHGDMWATFLALTNEGHHEMADNRQEAWISRVLAYEEYAPAAEACREGNDSWASPSR